MRLLIFTLFAFPAFAQPKPDVEAQLNQIAAVHGGAGPFAVAGYRMARHALEVLGLEPGSFDLDVEHHSPKAVQFSCIADGAQVFKPTTAFLERFINLPYEKSRENGRKVFALPDGDIFEVATPK